MPRNKKPNTPPPSREWREAELDHMLSMVALERPANEIAARLSRSVEEVEAKLSEMHTDQQKQQKRQVVDGKESEGALIWAAELLDECRQSRFYGEVIFTIQDGRILQGSKKETLKPFTDKGK